MSATVVSSSPQLKVYNSSVQALACKIIIAHLTPIKDSVISIGLNNLEVKLFIR